MLHRGMNNIYTALRRRVGNARVLLLLRMLLRRRGVAERRDEAYAAHERLPYFLKAYLTTIADHTVIVHCICVGSPSMGGHTQDDHVGGYAGRPSRLRLVGYPVARQKQYV